MDITTVVKEPYTGKVSGVRVIKLAWGLGVLAMWVKTCIVTGSLAAIPDSVSTILLGVLGVGAVQRFAEKDNKKPVPELTSTGS